MRRIGMVLAGVACLLAWPVSHGHAGQQDVHPKDHTITLKQAITLALKNNRSLQRSRLNVVSSNLNVEAKKSDFNIKVRPSTAAGLYSSSNEYWSGSLEFSKKFEYGITTSVTPELRRSGDTYKSSVEIALNIPLLNGFGREYTLDGLYSSQYDLENTKRSYYKQQVAVVLETVTTVYNIIKNQQQILLLTTQINILTKHLSLTKIKEKTGLSTAMDLYRAEIRMKDIQNELTSVEEALENHLDQLKSVLAVPMRGKMTVTAPIEYKPVVTNLDKAVAIALKNRIELEQAERRVGELKRKMILAKKGILPRLDLDVSYEKYGENSSFTLTDDYWTVSLSGSSDMMRTQQQTAFAQARINFRQSQIDMEGKRQEIVKSVRAHINKMSKKQQMIADRREQARQSQGKLDLAVSKFNHRLANNFDLLESQTQMQQVRSNLLFDTIGYIVDTYRLRSVLGTLIAR